MFEQLKAKGYSGKNDLGQILTWLRNKKKLHIEVYFSLFHKKWILNNSYVDLKGTKRIPWEEFKESSSRFDSWELAHAQGIGKFLKDKIV